MHASSIEEIFCKLLNVQIEVCCTFGVQDELMIKPIMFFVRIIFQFLTLKKQQRQTGF